MNNKKIHIIMVAQEGFKSVTCGIGMLVANLIDGIPELNKSIKVRNKIRLSVIGLARTKESIGYDAKISLRTAQVCKEFKGQAYYIKPRWRNRYGYFDIPIWKDYNLQARKKIIQLAKSDELTIVIHHDGIFGALQNLGSNIFSIWVPNSFGAVHKQTYTDQEVRMQWERDIVREIRKDPRSFVGSASAYVTEMLLKQYNVPAHKLLDTYNGFSANFLKRYERSQTEIAAVLSARGIPIDKDLILSYGRPDEYKGLEATLKALAQLARKSGKHVVMIASLFSKEPIVTKIQSALNKIQKQNQDVVSLVTDFEFTLPKLLLQWKQTILMACLPKRDFAPIVPTEGVLLGHKNLGIMVSEIPYFKSLYDVPNTIATPLKISSIIQAGERQIRGNLRTIRALGSFKSILRKHSNISRNYAIGFKQLFAKFPNESVIEKSAGAIVTRRTEGFTEILLVSHRDGTYVFPKGHIRNSENVSQAAVRELKEETGYTDIQSISSLGSYFRLSVKSSGRLVNKRISMYHVKLRSLKQSVKMDENYQWVPLKKAGQLLRYREDQDFLMRCKLR